MRLFYARFPAGLGDAQLLHTGMGVTIMYSFDDRPKFMFGQYLDGRLSGVVPENVFNQGMEAILSSPEDRVVIFDNPNDKGSLPYIIREIPIPLDVVAKIEEIKKFSLEQRKPLTFHQSDKPWLLKLVELFPEYSTKGWDYWLKQD